MCEPMEKLISKRLIWFLKKYKFICKFQLGFRRHRSTVENLAHLQTHIADTMTQKQNIEEAFDCVRESVILHRFQELNLSGNIY